MTTKGGEKAADGRGDRCRIVHGDAAEVLSGMPAESVRCVCTDPPYGIGVAGQEWDRRPPNARVWRECARVMEPGAFLFAMCSPRQDIAARTIASLEKAGLDVSFPPILWTYATGFSPAKSARYVAKRFGRSSNIGSGSEGGVGVGVGGPDPDGSYLGYMPRPAVELVLVGMRPPRDCRARIDQYAENGLAVTHLDDCRIPYAGDEDRKATVSGYYVPADGRPLPPGSALSRDGRQIRINGGMEVDGRGRFPSNLLCSGGALDDGRPHGNARGTYSRYFDLDAWAAEHLTPAVTAAPKPRRGERDGGLDGGLDGAPPVEPRPMSRRAEVTATATTAAVAAGNGAETPSNRHGRARRNNHPTVKPIALFAYLIHLGSRPGDTVLDPFAGSGTAALAASMTGRRCIGIERSDRYASIARTRIREYVMNARMEAFV